jgi:hypothetical protein
MITQQQIDDDQAFWCQLLMSTLPPELQLSDEEYSGHPVESYRLVILDLSEDESNYTQSFW